MHLWELLAIGPGLTALIGGGGKTTALRLLGEELAAAGRRVVLCTTTRIYPLPSVPLVTGGASEVAAALAEGNLVCAGTRAEGGKLAAPLPPMAELLALADCVLAEADGSRGLPLKAHLPHEPVLPPETGRTLCLVGASAFGRPVREAVHRPERFTALTGLGPEDAVTPAAAARLLAAEGLGDGVLVNQCDLPGGMEAAAALAAALKRPLWAGALERGEWTCLY